VKGKGAGLESERTRCRTYTLDTIETVGSPCNSSGEAQAIFRSSPTPDLPVFLPAASGASVGSPGRGSRIVYPACGGTSARSDNSHCGDVAFRSRRLAKKRKCRARKPSLATLNMTGELCFLPPGSAPSGPCAADSSPFSPSLTIIFTKSIFIQYAKSKAVATFPALSAHFSAGTSHLKKSRFALCLGNVQ